jgi:hypothetical protein
MEDVPPAVRDAMTFHLVDSIPEVLSVAFDELPSRHPDALVGHAQ